MTDGEVERVILFLMILLMLVPIGLSQLIAFAFSAGGKMYLLAFLCGCAFDALALAALGLWGRGKDI